MKSPFRSGWWSFDLGEYRPCSGTYQLYPYESVPPLDASLFRGEFQWLGEGSAPDERKPPAVVAEAEKQGLALPSEFVRFMSDERLQGAVPSCTACFWSPSKAPVPCRVVPGAFTIRFLRDQQDCLFWYLYVLPDGEASVICSPIPFDHPQLEVSVAQVKAHTWVVAPSFEEFVYRFWIENELWDELGRKERRLTPAQQAYVAHYEEAAAKKKAAKKTAAKKTAAKKAAARKAAAKKTPAKKTAKKTAANKTATKRASAKKAAAKKTAAKKTAAKKTAAKKTAAKKTAAKKASAKKAATKKTAAKKTAIKKSATKKTATKKSATEKSATKKSAKKS